MRSFPQFSSSSFVGWGGVAHTNRSGQGKIDRKNCIKMYLSIWKWCNYAKRIAFKVEKRFSNEIMCLYYPFFGGFQVELCSVVFKSFAEISTNHYHYNDQITAPYLEHMAYVHIVLCALVRRASNLWLYLHKFIFNVFAMSSSENPHLFHSLLKICWKTMKKQKKKQQQLIFESLQTKIK